MLEQISKRSKRKTVMCFCVWNIKFKYLIAFVECVNKLTFVVINLVIATQFKSSFKSFKQFDLQNKLFKVSLKLKLLC